MGGTSYSGVTNSVRRFRSSIMGCVPIQILAALLVIAISLQVRRTNTQDVSGQGHFTLMESCVQRIASGLANIYNTDCGQNNCHDCSQDMCQAMPDSERTCLNQTTKTSNLYNCSGVLKSSDADNICSSIYVASRGSVTYVRENGVYDLPSNTQQNAICRTQQLDPIFLDISRKTPIYTAFYAATVDGSRRNFPGREEIGISPRGESVVDSCRMFDSRKRPWYRGAISHPNHLVILIDCGFSMRADASATKHYGSRLNVSQRFAVELMATVYKDNYFNIFSFGASEDDTFQTSKLVYFDSNNPQSHPELDDVKQKVNSLRTADSDTSPSQFARGLNLTLRAFSETSNVTRTSRLLNVIVFTHGSFTDGSFSTDASVRDVLEQVKSNNVHLFIYGISSDSFDDGLQTLSNEVPGTYRNFKYTDFINPLFSMQSYFGYLAASHKNLYGDVPFWSPNFQEYYDVGDIVTGAMPVFNSNGSFVGVAGLNVILNELQSVGDDFRSAFDQAVQVQRIRQDSNSTRASNQNTVPVPETIDNSSCMYNLDESKILCAAPMLNFNEDTRFRKCCNSCPTRTTTSTIGIILGSVFAAFVVALAVVALVLWKRKEAKEQRKRKETEGTAPEQQVPEGTAPDTTVPEPLPNTTPNKDVKWNEPL